MSEREHYENKKYSCINCGKLTLETTKYDGYCEDCMNCLLSNLSLESHNLRSDKK